MKTYRVTITLTQGYIVTRLIQVNELDEVYECVEWMYPQSRIIGANAIQRIAESTKEIHHDHHDQTD